MNPVNYGPINLDTGLTQDLQENVESIHSVSVPTKYIEGEINNYYTKPPITYECKEEVQFLSRDESKTVDSQDELELWEPVEMQDILTRIADDQVIEVFMLEGEEIDFQGIDECKIVELQDRQEEEEYIVSEPVEMPDIPMRVIEEQEIEESIKEEECIKEIRDMTLPEMCSTKVRIHRSEKVRNARIKDTCRMQNESKLVQK